MSLSLYRKYRPQNFEEVIGQDDVVSSLKKQLDTKSVAHAYIFAGSRGTGKTTLARIFAKALGVSQNDLYEIDAASNRGIDDIRAVRDAVSASPFESPYKLYLIDEAHMLTKEAWNALLKTIEEPPAHAIFILATTELEKIPDTILSRCQVFSFKKPTSNTLSDLISKTAKKEGFSIEADAVSMIAALADGSFRDAHSILQKALSQSSDKKLSLSDLEKISGAPSASLANDVFDALSKKSASKLLKSLDTLRSEGRDSKALLALIIERVRLAILLRVDPSFADSVLSSYSDDFRSSIEKLSDDKSAGFNSDALLSLLLTYETVSRSSMPDIALEAGLLKLLGH